jgi:magnesium transporter
VSLSLSTKETKVSIDELHIQNILDTEHSSYFLHNDKYDLLILRFSELNENGLMGVSVPYLFQHEKVYRYDRNEKIFTLIENHSELLRLIEKQFQRTEWLIKKYIEETDNLEDELFTRKISAIFLDLWFDLKKDMTRVERVLLRAYEVLSEFISLYKSNDAFPEKTAYNILERVGRYQRLVSLNATKLDTLYNYYNSLKNDKINNNIYILTLLSGIFLPLNLIVGFFGMNTQNMFFTKSQDGTFNVFILLVATFIALVLLFPTGRLIQRFVLQRLLGKFNLYKKLVSKMKKIIS